MELLLMLSFFAVLLNIRWEITAREGICARNFVPAETMSPLLLISCCCLLQGEFQKLGIKCN